MAENETLQEREQRFARIWSDSRADAKKTQEFVANGLGVSKKTVQNWENGVTAPDLFVACEWFRILGLNPFPYLLSYIFPELYDNIPEYEADDQIEQALILMLKNSDRLEKRQLLYLMAGQHGSPWYSLLQMFTAHCHTSMKARVSVARSIVDNYEMEHATGDLVCTDSIKPDLQMLRKSIEEAKRSVMNGTNGYTNMVIEKNGETK